jgi:prepilin-type N-terminal cleavage/methylation domain-containing protein
LSKAEKAAVGAHVSAEYDKLLFQQPTSYISRNARADPERWQDGLREMIASDPDKLREIMAVALWGGGFTLIEMSIVLVIIGLIVGGVLVGQSLISAAGVRATISQIEKYNQAVNTFYGKYGYLPGDIPAGPASQFGFGARGQYAGEGDGNGILEGVFHDTAAMNNGTIGQTGELTMFWQDLSAARLIEAGFSSASSTTLPSGTITLSSSPSVDAYLPAAKIGAGNYIYVWSSGSALSGNLNGLSSGSLNFFGISAVSQIFPYLASVPALTVQQAYSIDTKIDDGLPQSGRVMASYVTNANGNPPKWAAGGGIFGAGAGPATTAPSATSCYDNDNISNTAEHYSLKVNNGAGVNCALSFQFQ